MRKPRFPEITKVVAELYFKSEYELCVKLIGDSLQLESARDFMRNNPELFGKAVLECMDQPGDFVIVIAHR